VSVVFPTRAGPPATRSVARELATALIVTSERSQSDELAGLLLDRGMRVVLVPSADVGRPDRMLRQAVLATPGGELIQLPRCALAPQYVFERPGPDADLSEAALLESFPGALLCRPPRSCASAAADPWSELRAVGEEGGCWLARVDAGAPRSEDQHQGSAIVFRHRSTGAIALAAAIGDWRVRFADLFGVDDHLQTLLWPLGSELTSTRLLILRATLDLERAAVVMHPGARASELPLLDGDASASDVLARLTGAVRAHRDTLTEEEVPEAAATCLRAVADGLLRLPALGASPSAHRLLPVLQVSVLLGPTDSVPVLADLRWVTVASDGGDHARELEVWLETAARRVRAARPVSLEFEPAAASRNGRAPREDAVHPLAALFPRFGDSSGLVATRAWPQAEFDSLQEGLRMSDTSQQSLLTYLGRVTAPDEVPTADDARWVEPGVGRTCLVDGLVHDERPDLRDFAVTGVGLTPYSMGGFALVGTKVTGRAALVRLRHRRRCSEQLESIGCRTARCAAVIALPGVEAMLPDGGTTEAGLIVRGFRCVLRVRQLDPVTALYNAVGLAPLVNEALLEHYRVRGDDTPLEPSMLLRALDHYAGGSDLRRILWPAQVSDTYHLAAIGLRRALIRASSRALVRLSCDRLALELGRDPDTEPVGELEYVAWFARSLGTQLAAWRRHRFLHDYHKAGVSRSTGLLTLVEQNVTLLAEFPDLDTALFVDVDEDLDALQLSAGDRRTLRDGFERFHAQDLHAARAVLSSLACAVLGSDRRTVAWAHRVLLDAYARSREAS
jgi:hypothetical protein